MQKLLQFALLFHLINVHVPAFGECEGYFAKYSRLFAKEERRSGTAIDRDTIYVAIKPIFDSGELILSRGQLALRKLNSSGNLVAHSLGLSMQPPLRIFGIPLGGRRPKITPFYTPHTDLVSLSHLVALMRGENSALSDVQLMELLTSDGNVRSAAIEQWEKSQIPHDVLSQRSDYTTPSLTIESSSSVYFDSLDQATEALARYTAGDLEHPILRTVNSTMNPMLDERSDDVLGQAAVFGILGSALATLGPGNGSRILTEISAAMATLKINAAWYKSFDYEGYGSVWFKNSITICRTREHYVIRIGDDSVNQKLAQVFDTTPVISSVTLQRSLSKISGSSWFSFDAAHETIASLFSREINQGSLRMSLGGLDTKIIAYIDLDTERPDLYRVQTIRIGRRVYFRVLPDSNAPNKANPNSIETITLYLSFRPVTRNAPSLVENDFPVDPHVELADITGAFANPEELF